MSSLKYKCSRKYGLNFPLVGSPVLKQINENVFVMFKSRISLTNETEIKVSQNKYKRGAFPKQRDKVLSEELKTFIEISKINVKVQSGKIPSKWVYKGTGVSPIRERESPTPHITGSKNERSKWSFEHQRHPEATVI